MRPRLTESGLPPGVYKKHGAYYLVHKSKWHRLGSDLSDVDEIKIATLRQDIDSIPLLKAYLERKIYSVKSGAKSRGMEFSLTKADVIELANLQSWRCAISDLPFSLRKTQGVRILPYAPSVDRIDHNKGYLPENIQIVCSSINIARSNLPNDIFLHLTVSTGLNLAKSFRQITSFRQNEK
jgi:hypothetical protein